VTGVPEALGVDLVVVLCAAAAGGEPAALGGHLQAADRGVVAGRAGELGGDRLTRQLAGGDILGVSFLKPAFCSGEAGVSMRVYWGGESGLD
jgi:hypothetical protein